MGRKAIDLSGRRFGRLNVITNDILRTDGRQRRERLWRCLCDCGNEAQVSGGNLRGGNVASCGCLRKENAHKTKHGWARREDGGPKKEYRIWAGIIKRCQNPACLAFPRYGGRGIMVCDRWLEFENFIADMGPMPSPNLTIERIDTDGHYAPGNCRWDTRTQQARNQRIKKSNTSGVTGVNWSKQKSKWIVRITSSNGRRFHVGEFMTVREAAEARRRAERYHWGI
jgi:hypothetical protein